MREGGRDGWMHGWSEGWMDVWMDREQNVNQKKPKGIIGTDTHPNRSNHE